MRLCMKATDAKSLNCAQLPGGDEGMEDVLDEEDGGKSLSLAFRRYDVTKPAYPILAQS